MFTGHKGSMEAKYTTNKGMLPAALVEEMRQTFRQSEELRDLKLQPEDTKQKSTDQEKQLTNLIQQSTQMVVAIDQSRKSNHSRFGDLLQLCQKVRQ
jgi:ribosomal protein S15P/S13E